MKNYHAGHRERMRAKFLESGLDGFHDHEILEMILFQTIPFKDTNTLAHQLIERFGSLSNVFDADYESLIQQKGVSHATAVNIMMLREIFARYKKSSADSVTVTKPSDMLDYAEMLFNQSPYERLVAVYMDSTTKVIGTKEYNTKQKGAIEVDCKTIVKDAMLNGAKAVFLVHCHLNNKNEPSQDDLNYTQKLFDVLKSVNILLLEHLIFTDNGRVYSFIKNGIFNKLKDKHFSMRK